MPESEEEFVKTTYCESGALSQYTLDNREILSTRYTSFFQRCCKFCENSAKAFAIYKKGLSRNRRRSFTDVAGKQQLANSNKKKPSEDDL